MNLSIELPPMARKTPPADNRLPALVDGAAEKIDTLITTVADESMFDFRLHTWGQQPGRLSHGVPHKLHWDKGSANTAQAVCNLLDALCRRKPAL